MADSAAESSSNHTTSTGSRPDLVRLADLVTHASLLLSHSNAGGSNEQKKYTRSRRGCLTCRLRKVKCDEVAPKCLRCAGMGRECKWDKAPASPPSSTDSSRPRSQIHSQSQSKPRAQTHTRSQPQIHSQLPPIVPISLPQNTSLITPLNPPSVLQAPPSASSMNNNSFSVLNLESSDFKSSSNLPLPDLDWLSDGTTLPALPVISRLFEEGINRSVSGHGIALNSEGESSKRPSKRKRGISTESPQEWREFVNITEDSPQDLATWASANSGIDPNIIQLQRQPNSHSISNDDTISLIPWTTPKPAPTPQANAETSLSLSMATIASRRRAQTNSNTTVLQMNYNPAPTAALDPFMHAFPTASARGLFKHYVDNTSGIVTAMGRTKPGHNPFLAVSLPLILTDTASPACAALRFSLLTTSAAHILHLRGGHASDVAELGDKLKKLAIGYTVISQSSGLDEDADMILAASVIIMTRDVLSADRSWRSNLDFAIQLIRKRGGPEQMMARDPTSFTKRFVLEQISTHEVFSCFTTGSEPTLLQPFASWWFDVEKSSRCAWEWESVEQLFGVSRAMVEVIARICALCARKARLGVNLSLDEPDMAPVASFLRNEAEVLIKELEIFGISLRSLPLHRRVQYGDHIYRMVMSLHLMNEILGYSSDHPRVRAIVPAALELCSEISMQPVMLAWPLMILAKAANMEEREWLKMLLKTYGEQYCRDLETAEEIVMELWKRQDRGDPPISWTTLMTECDKFVLLI